MVYNCDSSGAVEKHFKSINFFQDVITSNLVKCSTVMKGSGYSAGGLMGYVAWRCEDYQRTNDV